jgi:hypothetical protein
MHSEVVGALLSILILSGAIATLLAVVLRHKRQVRELLSRERLAALDKGVEIPWEMDIPRPRRSRRLHLKLGVLLLGASVGLALVAPFAGDPENRNVTLIWSLFFLAMGVTGLVYDRFFGKAEWERSMALDEALTRAYIRRLEGSTAGTHGSTAETARDGR